MPFTSRPVEERFWEKVDTNGPSGCWSWGGSRSSQGPGYGQILLDGHKLMAHRFSYEMLVGPIPAGMEIDHLCRNMMCVNPSHLEPVTHRVNVLRGVVPHINGDKTHCKRGHPFDEVNTYHAPSGRRACRACMRWRGLQKRLVAA